MYKHVYIAINTFKVDLKVLAEPNLNMIVRRYYNFKNIQDLVYWKCSEFFSILKAQIFVYSVGFIA